VICSLKTTNKINFSACQRISNINCMNYDHNQFFGLFKFHSGYVKFYLNSPKGYNRKIINAQTAINKHIVGPQFQTFTDIENVECS